MRGRYVHRVWRHDPTLYAPASYRRACGYDAFIPDPLSDLSVELPGDVVGVLSDAEQAISELNRTAAPALAPLARLLLRTESVASSKVEGMQLDARTLARAEARAEAGRHIGTQAADILANVDAMDLAVETASGAEEVEVQSIKAIHRALLSQDPMARRRGEFRDSQNWIGGNDYNPCGADFVPPPPAEVGALMDDLCAFCNEEGLSGLLQAAIAHAQFETIHPFGDGNGRTGRALVQVILRRRGVAPAFVPPVSLVLARHKDGYVRGLVSYREGQTAEWVRTFAAAAAAAARLGARYGERVVDLQARWRGQLREHADPRSDAAAWAIIDVLPAHPIITVPIAVAATRRTRPAVTNAVDQLQAAGVLTPLGSSARNRSWEGEGLLDAIVEFESGGG
jgi:Fic family protein